MEPNKNIQIELTPFEAKQLKKMVNTQTDLKIFTGIFLMMTAFLLALTIVKILAGDILLGTIGIFVSAYSLYVLVFNDTSFYDNMTAINQIGKKL